MSTAETREQLERRLQWDARSISRPAAAVLQRRPFVARVLAVFERALDLVTPDGEVVALVAPEIGDGPLNVVIAEGSCAPHPPQSPPASNRPDAAGNDWIWFEREITAGLPAAVRGEELQVGGLLVALSDAVAWEPCPDWGALRARREVVAAGLKELVGLFLPSLGEGRGRWGSEREELSSLRAGWNGDVARLRAAAAQLAGLGSGLTPAGDDFLCGAMLAAWILHPDPPWFCQAVVETAAPRTTALAAAFLRAAGRGECSAAWHRLLAGLSPPPLPPSPPPAGEGRGAGGRGEARQGLASAVQSVLSYGATSGADALTGFLWAACQPRVAD